MLNAAFRARLGPTDRRKLISGIHAQAHALQLDDETRREMQLKLVGVESSKDMSLGQLSTVWTRLTALAKDAGLAGRAGQARRKRPGRDERQPAEPPTIEQLEYIRGLYDDLGVSTLSSDMMALSRRITGHAWPQNREEANKLIEGLKAMKARGWRARDAGRATGDTVYESPITP
jgi:hypothetical protein